MFEEISSITNTWDDLQQPAHPGQGMHAAYRGLLSAVDLGWRVEKITRKASALRLDSGFYLFVLRLTGSDLVRHFMVPAAPEVEKFIQNYGYPVN